MTNTYGTYDLDSFSDLHKDAYGCRPSQYFWEWISKASPEELQGEWNFLCQEAERVEQVHQEAQATALVNLEAQLAKTMADNRVDMATAIRWLDDAYGTNRDYQFLDFYLGVKYGTIEKMLGLKPTPIGFLPSQAA